MEDFVTLSSGAAGLVPGPVVVGQTAAAAEAL